MRESHMAMRTKSKALAAVEQPPQREKPPAIVFDDAAIVALDEKVARLRAEMRATVARRRRLSDEYTQRLDAELLRMIGGRS
jgi:hypothetical protein